MFVQPKAAKSKRKQPPKKKPEHEQKRDAGLKGWLWPTVKKTASKEEPISGSDSDKDNDSATVSATRIREV